MLQAESQVALTRATRAAATAAEQKSAMETQVSRLADELAEARARKEGDSAARGTD